MNFADATDTFDLEEAREALEKCATEDNFFASLTGAEESTCANPRREN